MKSISLILIFLHMIWKSIAIIYSLRGTTLLRLITIEQRGHDALHRYQIEWRSLTFDNITLSNHLFSMDNWCVMFYNINSINIERTILWMKNIIFTLSFDQVTWKSTEGLKVRLTVAKLYIYSYTRGSDMFIINLQFTVLFCEIADLERENTFWKCTLPQLSPVYPGWQNWHSLPAKYLRHKTHPSSISQSKHLSLQLVQFLPYWFTSQPENKHFILHI